MSIGVGDHWALTWNNWFTIIDPLYTYGFFLLVWYNKFRIVHCIYQGVSPCQVIIFSKNIVFFCLNIFFTLTNIVDTDEILHYVAFHLGLHCFCLFWFFTSQSTIFQLCRDRSSWIEPVLSKDKWAATWDYQQCGICNQQRLRPACAHTQSDQSLC